MEGDSMVVKMSFACLREMFRSFLDVFWLRFLQTSFLHKFIGYCFKIFLAPFIFLKFFYLRFLLLRIPYLPQLSLDITSHCTLNCRYCCALLPYDKNRRHSSKKEILEDIRCLLRVVQKIGSVHILGGEALLHPDLPDIIENLIKIDRVKEIHLITNGSLLPSAELLNVLRNPKVSVEISDYINVQNRCNEVFQCFKKESIQVSFRILSWQNLHFSLSKKRTEKQLKEIFDRCCSKTCLNLRDGIFTRCQSSCHLMALGMVPYKSGDFVNIRHSGSREERKRLLYELENLLFNKKFLRACDYCDGYYKDGNLIPVAEQLPFGTFLSIQDEDSENIRDND